MRGQRFGKWIRSRSEAWAAGSTISFNLDFLRQVASYAAPVIRQMELRFAVNYTMGGGATWNLVDQTRWISNILIKDAAGERLNMNGAGLFHLEHNLNGTCSTNGNAALATGGPNNAVITVGLPFVRPLRAKRPADFGLPVSEFLTGEFTVALSAAAPITNLTINSGSLELWCYVEDEGVRELKSRLVVREFAMVQQEDWYPANGDLTILGSYAVAGATTPGFSTAWGALGEITSRDLDIIRVRQDILKVEYLKGASNPVVSPSDPVAALTFFQVRSMLQDDKYTSRRPLAGSVHLDLGAAPPALSRVIVGVVTDRNPDVSRATLGFRSTAAMREAIKSAGVVKQASGSGDRRVTSYSPLITQRAPVKLTANVGDVGKGDA